MFNINELIDGDISKYDEETRLYIDTLREKLRENIKEALVDDMAEKMIDALNSDKEEFRSILETLLENKNKGLNNLPLRTLLDMYITKKGQENFVKLIEKTSEEL
ncbi:MULTISPECIES: hypothetical protein [Clostridium]|uniref:Uncharacterized protein n=1 Tax=Clostridium cadaveris TaxID=1529 RepID=A0A1I2M0G6_9CLOT|nr:hypothetical protein [Clostridium cadaveris]MDU4950746.1 hypothetical protein [Clostridium sp.]MDM8312408.1 hypothetical protein [Clostridium cadaveris]MDY4948589.1 hypothetical protein [Clostridium cadaveris]NME63660.1 hypothetical protein [Clostridium cadaveris]NWK12630.1 hypothetical protein [Clostridium cadaveris]